MWRTRRHKLHPWQLDPDEAISLQFQPRERLALTWDGRPVTSMAGQKAPAAAGRSQISFQREGARNTGRGVDRAQTIAGVARDRIGERVQWYDLSEEVQRG